MIVSPLNLILARAHLEHPPKDLVGLLIALELEGESEPLWSELAQLRQVNEDGRILASTLAAGAWREYFAWTVGISSDIGKGFPPPHPKSYSRNALTFTPTLCDKRACKRAALTNRSVTVFLPNCIK